MNEQMTPEQQLAQFTVDARRTEPDYEKLVERFTPHTIRLLYAAMGMSTEANELLDMVRAHIFYGKPLDRTNGIEEMGDSSWYSRIGCDELGMEYIEVIRRNIAKLKARYPVKFTEENALNRDLEAERVVLEGKKNVCPECVNGIPVDVSGDGTRLHVHGGYAIACLALGKGPNVRS